MLFLKENLKLYELEVQQNLDFPGPQSLYLVIQQLLQMRRGRETITTL